MMQKAKAVIEVGFVFGLTLLLIVLAGLSPLGNWEQEASNRYFTGYGIMILFPLLVLLATRRNLAAYGLKLRNFSYHFEIAATAFLPVALASLAFAFADHQAWHGSLIHAALKIAVLFAIGRLLQGKPTANSNGALHITILPLIFVLLFTGSGMANALSAFVFYLFFVGLGEEFLFRGYIQSRLNIAFGRPYKFFGVSYGWGIVMASALYGLMHVLNIGSLVGNTWVLSWWWGFWTFFGGLVLGFVREKTGSIIAPALLHGLPQAIAYAVMGF